MSPKASSFRYVTESIFVHFFLLCGHLITMSNADIGETMPREIDCWACAAEESGPQPGARCTGDFA
jgi:hypothetical protein